LSTTLERFFQKDQNEKREKSKQKPSPQQTPEERHRKIYIITHQAYGKFCSKCRMLLKKEKIGSPMFAYRIFCGAEYCIKQH